MSQQPFFMLENIIKEAIAGNFSFFILAVDMILVILGVINLILGIKNNKHRHDR